MNSTQLAARLHDWRDAAKQILGVNYAARMSDLGGAIKAAADRNNQDVLKAGMDICTTNNLQGLNLLFTMVAVVELIEPSCIVNSKRS